MSFTKIKSNIPPFDELFEGFYIAHPALLSGKRGSGTSTLAVRFLSNLIRIGEKVLLFTDQPPDHVSLTAYGLGNDISAAIESEQLSIVPYDEHLPLLPFPEALDELRALITGRHYSFIVFDPVMPWLAAPAAQLDERLDAFFGLLADTAPTTLLILHHPVSRLARRLFDAVSERCAISIAAARTHEGPYTLTVTKYMGAPPEKCPALLQLPSAPATAEAPGGPSTPYQTGTPSLQDLHQRLRHDHPAPPPPPQNPAAARPGPYTPTSNFFSAAPGDAPARPPSNPFQTATAPAAAASAAPPPRPAPNSPFFAAAAPTETAPAAPAAPAHDPTRPISFANILQDDSTFFAAPPSRFATAASAGTPRPPVAPVAPTPTPPPELTPPEYPLPHWPHAHAAHAPSAPAAPAPAAPAHAHAPADPHAPHAIRFSDIIQ